jgi:hypothetical protein
MTVERVVMTTIARISRNQRPTDPRNPVGRHGFIRRTVPRLFAAMPSKREPTPDSQRVPGAGQVSMNS